MVLYTILGVLGLPVLIYLWTSTPINSGGADCILNMCPFNKTCSQLMLSVVLLCYCRMHSVYFVWFFAMGMHLRNYHRCARALNAYVIVHLRSLQAIWRLRNYKSRLAIAESEVIFRKRQMDSCLVCRDCSASQLVVC